MHQQALDLMNEMLDDRPIPVIDYYPNIPLVLDVGSLDINGTLRPLAEGRGCGYIGVDIREGPNVDEIMVNDHIPYANNSFAAVLSANALHNMAHPWLMIPEMVRVLKPGGLLAIVAIWKLGENQYGSGDYYRYMPDGLRELFDLTGQLKDYRICIANDQDVIGSATKI